jgi:hypothetical protein
MSSTGIRGESRAETARLVTLIVAKFDAVTWAALEQLMTLLLRTHELCKARGHDLQLVCCCRSHGELRCHSFMLLFCCYKTF